MSEKAPPSPTIPSGPPEAGPAVATTLPLAESPLGPAPSPNPSAELPTLSADILLPNEPRDPAQVRRVSGEAGKITIGMLLAPVDLPGLAVNKVRQAWTKHAIKVDTQRASRNIPPVDDPMRSSARAASERRSVNTLTNPAPTTYPTEQAPNSDVTWRFHLKRWADSNKASEERGMQRNLDRNFGREVDPRTGKPPVRPGEPGYVEPPYKETAFRDVWGQGKTVRVVGRGAELRREVYVLDGMRRPVTDPSTGRFKTEYIRVADGTHRSDATISDLDIPAKYLERNDLTAPSDRQRRAGVKGLRRYRHQGHVAKQYDHKLTRIEQYGWRGERIANKENHLHDLQAAQARRKKRLGR